MFLMPTVSWQTSQLLNLMHHLINAIVWTQSDAMPWCTLSDQRGEQNSHLAEAIDAGGQAQLRLLR